MTIFSRKNYEYFILFLVSVLMFLWPIENVTSKKNLVTYIIVILLLNYIRKYNNTICLRYLKDIKIVFGLLIGLILWMVCQSILISSDTVGILDEIRGQFLTPVLYFIIGIGLFSLKFLFINKKIFFNVIFFSGFIHILIILLYSVYYFLMNGSIPYRHEVLIRVDEVSFYANIIYLLFITEIYSRVKLNKHYLYLNNYIMFLVVLIFVFSVSLQGMRLGVLSFIGSSFLFFILLIYMTNMSKVKKSISIFFIILSLFLMLLYSVNKDNRWSTLIETANIAISSDSLYWLDRHKYPAPKLNSGEKVNLSNYLRIAQQVNGYKLVVDYPLGTGYSRRAYKHTLQDKYKEGYGHPHSGILNFILGVGVFGFLIYLLFLITIIKKVINNKATIYSFFTIFLIITYHSRALIDMTMQNHMLQIFFFLLGIGLAGSLSDKEEQLR